VTVCVNGLSLFTEAFEPVQLICQLIIFTIEEQHFLCRDI
jgi:hypothetical protein